MLRYRLDHDECRKFKTHQSPFYRFPRHHHSLYYHRVTGVTQFSRSNDQPWTNQLQQKSIPHLPRLQNLTHFFLSNLSIYFIHSILNIPFVRIANRFCRFVNLLKKNWSNVNVRQTIICQTKNRTPYFHSQTKTIGFKKNVFAKKFEAHHRIKCNESENRTLTKPQIKNEQKKSKYLQIGQ